MSRMIFDLTEDDRAALERLRAARGLRSQAEVLRALIRESTADGFVTVGIVATPEPTKTVRLEPINSKAPRVVKGVIEPAARVDVPVLGSFARGPMQKKAK